MSMSPFFNLGSLAQINGKWRAADEHQPKIGRESGCRLKGLSQAQTAEKRAIFARRAILHESSLEISFRLSSEKVNWQRLQIASRRGGAFPQNPRPLTRG